MDNALSPEAKQLAIARKQLEIIRNVSAELNMVTGLHEKLSNILQILDNQFGIAHSMLLLPDMQQQILRVYASRGYPETTIEVPFKRGIAGMAADKRIPINLTGLRRKRLYLNSTVKQSISTEPSLPGLENAESQIAIPLLVNNELVAVLVAESYASSVFGLEDEKFLMTLTPHMAVAIQNAMLFERMEEKIKERTTELTQLNQTKDKLFSIISHDLRSPVTSFQSVTQLLKHYASKGELDKIENLSDKIDQSVTKLNFLLDNLLNWSLSQGGHITCHYESILLLPFVKEIVSMHCETFTAKNIQVTISISEEENVLADANTLSVIFRNLVSNALKFTCRDGHLCISAMRNEGLVHIEVRDDGIGICEEQLGVLFSLTNKKSTLGTEKERGTGLGLALVHEFVQLNHGHIEAKSKPNEGTCFVIQLPVARL